MAGWGNSPWGSSPWGTGLVVEEEEKEEVVALVFQDNYKAKLARQTIPEVYDNRLTSMIGRLVTTIATSDNNIGGLSVKQDFLPDEVI